MAAETTAGTTAGTSAAAPARATGRLLTGLTAAALAAAMLTAPLPSGATAARAGNDRIVVAISVDGLSVRAIKQLGSDGMPHLYRMLDQGAGTLNARTAVESTRTLPNHTGMLTGRRITTTRGHRVTFNEDNGGTVHRAAGTYRASVFDVVHDNGMSTGLYAAKSKFALFDRSWGPRFGAPDTTGADDGRDKIDTYVSRTSKGATLALVDRLRISPQRFSFLHLSLPDEAGHEHGFRSAAYLDAVRRADALVGRVLAAVDADADLRARVDVVLTADHGGAAVSHADPAKPGNYTIPFVVWGADADGGADLYSLNPERRRPGTGRPSYADPPPVRNADVAALALSLLGLTPKPGMMLPGTTALEVADGTVSPT